MGWKHTRPNSCIDGGDAGQSSTAVAGPKKRGWQSATLGRRDRSLERRSGRPVGAGEWSGPSNSLRKSGVSPLARGHVEMRAKRPVEMRQIVESPPIGNFGNVQQPLIRIAQRSGARFKSALQHPAAECLADL